LDDRIVLLDGAPTPIGSFGGAFADVPAHILRATAVRGALECAGLAVGRSVRWSWAASARRPGRLSRLSGHAGRGFAALSPPRLHRQPDLRQRPAVRVVSGDAAAHRAAAAVRS